MGSGYDHGEVLHQRGFRGTEPRGILRPFQVNGDQIIVRGEATGTPKTEFWGAKPTGKGFKTMALDIFTVKNGKLAFCYHVENWITALQQIGK